MIDINIDSAAENFDVIFDNCVKNDSIYRIKTHKGNVIMLSEKRYKKILKAIENASILKSLKEINQTPTDEFKKTPPWN
jgi:hypothetical protein